MSDYFEATLLLFPPDAGGREKPVAPREGSYRPFARVGSRLCRMRLIEGPPLLAPGDAARVVAEIDGDAAAFLRTGAEVQVLEHDERLVGVLTIARVCGRAVPA